MYRHRIHVTVSSAHNWNEALEVMRDMNGVATRLNQPSASVWTETVGEFNRLVVEIEYESLAAFETGQNEMSADPEWPALVARLDPILVEGTGYSELLEEATPLGGSASAGGQA